MSSCMAPTPYAFQAGGVCAGNGVCVNSSLTPGLLLCKCNSGYSGACDFFDNRVERLPDGTWLSYSCNDSAIGAYVIWSLFTLLGLLRLKSITPLWIQYMKRHYGDPVKRAEGIWNNAPLRIVTVDLFGVSIPYLITGICKLAGQTFGTDVLPTIGIIFTASIFQLVVFDLARTEFGIFIQGTANPLRAQNAKHAHAMYKCCGLGIFFLCNTIPSFWSLSTDKSKGPSSSGGSSEELVIYIRNMGAVVWGIAEVSTTWLIRKMISGLLTVDQGPQDAVSFVIRKMDKELRAFIVFMSVLGCMYAVFIIPYLLPYQTYLIAFIVGLGSTRNSAKAFANEEQAKARGVSMTESKGRIDLTKSSIDAEKSSEGGTIPKLKVSKVASSSFVQQNSTPSLNSGSRTETLGLVPIAAQSSASAPSSRASTSSKDGSHASRHDAPNLANEKAKEDV